MGEQRGKRGKPSGKEGLERLEDKRGEELEMKGGVIKMEK